MIYCFLMIIVTGATGFIGRRVVKLLVRKYKPSSILCLIWKKNSELETSGRKILSNLMVKTIKVDLVTKANLKPIIKSPSIVIHLAGNTDTYSSDYRCNDIGTRNLLECLKGLGPKTHFVHISTTAIMSGRLNCKNTFNENATPVPTNNYGFSKLTAETLVQKSCLKHGFKLSIIRYPTVYGKDPRKNSFFDYLKGLIEKNSPLMRLNWPGLSSFVHVDDAAKSVLLMLDKPPKPRRWEIFNVSTESLTLKQISILLYNKMKLKYKPLYLPKIIWRILTQTRPVIYKLENYLSPTIYNSLWRATLLIDNVIFCNKLENTFSQWKPLLLSDKLDDVI